MLAQRIGNEDLKNWVISELTGYGPRRDLPDYRILQRPTIFGHYVGFGGAQLQNIQIPDSAFPQGMLASIAPLRFYQGVSELAALIAGAKDNYIWVGIPPEALQFIRYVEVRGDMQLVEARKASSTSFINGILDTVRNRILDFTLELEDFAETAGDPLMALKGEKSREVQQTFNTHIMGAVSNLNQGGDHVSQCVTINQGDLDAVTTKLADMGFSVSEIADFKDALESERPEPDGTLGSKVSSLLGKAVQKAASGALSITSSVGSSLLLEVIKGYYGI